MAGVAATSAEAEGSSATNVVTTSPAATAAGEAACGALGDGVARWVLWHPATAKAIARAIIKERTLAVMASSLFPVPHGNLPLTPKHKIDEKSRKRAAKSGKPVNKGPVSLVFEAISGNFIDDAGTVAVSINTLVYFIV